MNRQLKRNIEIIKRKDEALSFIKDVDARECRRCFSYMPEPAQVIVVLGFEPHFLKALLEKEKTSFIIVAEHEPSCIRYWMEKEDLSFLKEERVSLIVLKKQMELLREYIEEYFEVIAMTNISVVAAEGIQKEAPLFYKALNDALEEILRIASQNLGTLKEFVGLWQDNIFANLINFLKTPGIIRLFGTLEGVPAIIVGAGPSLEENVHHLKSAMHRAYIISADTAVYRLLSEGIFPDAVVCVDARKKVDVPEESIFFWNAAIDPENLKNIKKNFVFHLRHPFCSWIEAHFEPKGSFGSGGNVCGAAFSIAMFLKASPLILVGQDLAFKEGITHSPSTLQKEIEHLNRFLTLETLMWYRFKERAERGIIKVKGVKGEEVLTDKGMLRWIKWYEYMIKRFAIHCIQATEGGARIEGAECMRLKDAINRYCRRRTDAKKMHIKIFETYKPPSKKKLLSAFNKLSLSAERVAFLCERIKKIEEKTKEFKERSLPLDAFSHSLRMTLEKIKEEKEFWLPFHLCIEGFFMQGKETFFDAILTLCKKVKTQQQFLQTMPIT